MRLSIIMVMSAFIFGTLTAMQDEQKFQTEILLKAHGLERVTK